MSWDLTISPESSGTPIVVAAWNGSEQFRSELDPRRPSSCNAYRRNLAKVFPAVESDPAIAEQLNSEFARLAAEMGGRAKAQAAIAKPTVTAAARYVPFPTDCLPDVLARFVRGGAAAIQCDEAAIALPLLAGLASAIGNTRCIRLRRTWTEPSVLWTATIAESGSKKSPSLDLALKPVWARQRKLLNDYRRARAAYEAARRQWTQMAKSERGDEPQAPPPCEHTVCDDVTVEALAVVLEATPRGTLVARDELAGWFASFDQYKSARGADVARWLTIHRAGTLKVDRKTGDKATIFVPHAAVSLTGTIQPDTLRSCLPKENIHNGLAARFLLALPPERVPRWSEDELDPAVEQAVEKVFDRLYQLDGVEGADGNLEPRAVDLDDAAKLAWIEFFEQHAEETAELRGSPLGFTWSKLEGYAARLALILHLVRQAAGEPVSDYIEELDVRAGVRLVRWFGAEAKRVYGMLAETGEERRERELVDWIGKRGGRVSVRDLCQRKWRYRGHVELAQRDLQALVDGGAGHWQHPKPGARGGQPVELFVLSNQEPINGISIYDTPAPAHSSRGSGDVDVVARASGG